MSYTRNRLIEKAQGRYIWFVDPDDMLYPGIVNSLIKKANELDSDFIFGNYIRIPEKAKIEFEPNKSITVFPGDGSRIVPKDSNGKMMCSVWAGLFKRSFLNEYNLRFNDNMIAQEDTLFYYEMGLKVRRIHYVTEPVYIYRQRSSSIMHRHDSRKAMKYYKSMYAMLDVYENYYSQNDCEDKERLKLRILQQSQNLALCLVAINDTKFVRKELKSLKAIGHFPLKSLFLPSSPIQSTMIKMLKNDWGFWILHTIYRIRYKLSDSN